MTQRHTFRLNNGNEVTVWSGYSPDQTFAIIQDRAHFKNAADLIKDAKENGWDKIEEGK
jgi:hypothetical protein